MLTGEEERSNRMAWSTYRIGGRLVGSLKMVEKSCRR
jgi:hypothetical protein